MNNLKIYFLSADYIKQNSPIIDDVENTLITSHILEAQNIDLQECIGENLYTYYINKLSGYTSGDDLSIILGADYYNLFENYIRPALHYKSIYYSMYDLFAKITAKGINNQKSEYSETIDLKVLEAQRKQYKYNADYYFSQLIDYLNENYSDFTEYVPECTNCGDDNVTGLYLGDEI